MLVGTWDEAVEEGAGDGGAGREIVDDFYGGWVEEIGESFGNDAANGGGGQVEETEGPKVLVIRGLGSAQLVRLRNFRS